MKTISRKIIGGNRLVLSSEDQNALEAPLFAINWFNTKVAWVYHLYNKLASGLLFQVGGKVLFKGKVGSQIGGQNELGRDYLLLVNYPSGEKFLNLASHPLFLVISVLRVWAVQQFSFVFHERLEEPRLLTDRLPRKDWVGSRYVILHFTCPDSELDTKFEQLANAAEIDIYFSSKKSVSVETVSREGTVSPIPYITENVILFSSDSPEQLTKFVESKELTETLGDVEKYFLADIERTL